MARSMLDRLGRKMRAARRAKVQTCLAAWKEATSADGAPDLLVKHLLANDMGHEADTLEREWRQYKNMRARYQRMLAAKEIWPNADSKIVAAIGDINPDNVPMIMSDITKKVRAAVGMYEPAQYGDVIRASLHACGWSEPAKNPTRFNGKQGRFWTPPV